MGIPLYSICCFSLAAFNIFSLYLIFDSLINMGLGVILLGFILYGTHCVSWTLLTISFPILGKFPTIISSNVFSVPFFFTSSSGTTIVRMLVCLMLSQRSLRLSSIIFILFSLCCSVVVISTIFSSRSHICSSVSVILLLIPSREFYISFIVLFIIVCLLFSSSRSLLNVSCMFSILFPRFWIIFTTLLWILFQVDCLFPLHLFGLVGFYLARSSTAYFSVFSFCLIYCVWGLLFSGCRFIVPIVFGVCPQGWFSGLCRLPGGRDWCLCSDGWGWILSFFWAEPCPVVCLVMSVNLLWF